MVVLDFLHRWLYADFWVPVWPNLAAAALCAVHISRSNRKTLGLYLGDRPGPDNEEDDNGTIQQGDVDASQELHD